MCMRIFPKYRSRSVGERIQYNDEISIMGYLENFSLDFAQDLPHDLNNYKFKKVESVFRKPINSNDKRGIRYRAIFGAIKKTCWNLVKFRDYNDEKEFPNVLNSFDMVRINHTELVGKLCSAICYQTKTPEVYVRIYENENHPEEHKDVSTIWELEKTDEFSGTGIKMFKEEDENTNDAFLYTEDLRLRHFLSRGLLSITPYKKDLLTLLNLDHEDTVPKNYVKIRLEPLLKSMNHALKDCAYMIGHNNFYLKWAQQIPSLKRNKH
jgi:hypothetical protein